MTLAPRLSDEFEWGLYEHLIRLTKHISFSDLAKPCRSPSRFGQLSGLPFWQGLLECV